MFHLAIALDAVHFSIRKFITRAAAFAGRAKKEQAQ